MPVYCSVNFDIQNHRDSTIIVLFNWLCQKVVTNAKLKSLQNVCTCDLEYHAQQSVSECPIKQYLFIAYINLSLKDTTIS